MEKSWIRTGLVFLGIFIIGITLLTLLPKNGGQPLGNYFSVAVFLGIITLIFVHLRNQIKNNYFYLGSILHWGSIKRKDRPNWRVFSVIIPVIGLILLIVLFLVLIYSKI